MDDTTDENSETHEEETVGPNRPPRAPPSPESDVDEEEAFDLNDEATQSDSSRRARWQSRRPRIDHLKDGVTRLEDEDGTLTFLPLFDIGDRIVVDVRTSLLTGDPWLHTIVGKVRSINDDTGLVTLGDEDGDSRLLTTRYVSIKDPLSTFKIAPLKGDPFNAERIKAVKPPPAPGEVRRGRGRPAGSKNRSKEEIKAEREAYKAAREAKRGKRR